MVMLRHKLLVFTTCVLLFAAALPAQTLASASVPIYPLSAKAAGIEGQVVLRALVTKDGQVRELRVLGGPAELRQAALHAVETWTYKPYLQRGHPVDVKTTITVNFSMGSPTKKAAEQAKAKEEIAKANQQRPTIDPAQPISPPQ